MYQNELDYLSRKVKRTYKRYTGERTDEKATLSDVAKFFNIPIDESRVEDYQVTKINFYSLEIEILDTKTNTTYNAHYTMNAELFNSYGGEVRYNSLVSTNENRKTESLYYIGKEEPIITVMTFYKGDYELVFEREMPNFVGTFGTPNERFAVRYLVNVKYKGENVKQNLLTRIFANNYVEESGYSKDDYFEQFYTYRTGQNFINCNDNQNKYAYVRDNNLVYAIEKLEPKDIKNYIVGICFENTKMDKSYTYPHSISESDYPLLNDSRTNSAMIFSSSDYKSPNYTLEIYKDNYSINLKYRIKKSIRQNGVITEAVVEQKMDFPVLNEKNITSEEIKKIVAELQAKYSDDEFIQLVSNELSFFAIKLDIKNGLIKEDLDPLSPKLLSDKSFDEICDLVSSNKDAYFDLVLEQFETATNIKIKDEKGLIKTFTPKKIESNNN